MKITFQNQTINENDNRTESNRTEKNSWGKDKTWRSKKSVNVNFGAVYESGQAAVPMSSLEKEENNKGKSLIELQQDAGNANVALQQDYMTLLSHTMSQEDYAKACEDGFDPRELDQNTAVTIVDKIKAELVRSGQQIAGYTDDIDMDTLAAAVGSDTLARSIEEQFRSADLPLTQENINELKSAWDMAASLKEPEEGAVSYLVDNGLEPEIWNLYVAENSGAKVQQNTVPQEQTEGTVAGKCRPCADHGYAAAACGTGRYFLSCHGGHFCAGSSGGNCGGKIPDVCEPGQTGYDL